MSQKNTLTTEQKEQILVEYLQEAKGEALLQITNYLMIRLAGEAIEMNAEVINMSTSIHPKGVEERRDIALVVFQKRQSENKVKDLSALLQAAPELLEACQTALQDTEMLLSGECDYSEDNLKSTISILQNAIKKATEGE